MDDHASIVTKLQETDLFKSLPAEDIERIAAIGSLRTYQKNDIVCKEGSIENELYVIFSGKVSIWKSYETPDAIYLGSYEAGSILGEIGVIEQIPRSATIVSTMEIDVFVIDGLNIRKILNENSQVAGVFLRSLTKIVVRNTSELTQNLQLQNTALKNAHNKLKEQQETMLRTECFTQLGKLSSLVVHDLRSSVSSLQLLEHLLRNRAGDERFVLTISDRLKEQCRRLESFIEDLLDLVSGNETLEVSSVSINSLFMNLVERWRMQCDEQKITLRYKTDGEAVAFIDLMRVERMLFNVIDNAIKASAEGKEIHVSSTIDDNVWNIVVEDFGVGMEEEDIKKVFDPFFTKFHGGHGLGMVSVQKVIIAHRGKIAISSEVDKGTTITITIPLAYANS